MAYLTALLVALGIATPFSLLLSVPRLTLLLHRRAQWGTLAWGAALVSLGSSISLIATNDLILTTTALAGILGAVTVASTLFTLFELGLRFDVILELFIGISVVMVLEGTIQVDIEFAKINHFSAPIYAWFTHLPHVSSVGFSQNATGALIVATLPWVGALFARARQPAVRSVLVLTASWFIFALALTLSRGAFLGLAFSTFVMAWLAGGYWRWTAPVVPGTILLALLSGATGYAFTLSADPTGWSSIDRWYIWHAALRIIADYPLTGPGAGTFPVRIPSYSFPPDTRDIPHAHDFVLQTYLDSGLIGVVGLILVVLATVATVRALLRLRSAGGERPLVIALVGCLVGVAGQGLVDAYFWGDPRVFYIVTIPLAVLAALGRAYNVSPPLLDPVQPVQLAMNVTSHVAGVPVTRFTRGVRAWVLIAVVTLVVAPPALGLAATNTGTIARNIGERLPPGSPAGSASLVLAQLAFTVATSVTPKYGPAWQGAAEVAIDRKNVAAATRLLGRARLDGISDALVTRDAQGIDLMALAFSGPTVRPSH
ncbi:MAG: O-antigen ligase family protein [Chloroflexi bacterium]|nr:O-antigen ligase family protein [Chloroflexota bacterium]